MTPRALITRTALGAIALLAVVPVGALDAPAPTPTVPPQMATCIACHGAQGISINDDIPNLAGQKPNYLAAQLAAFKSGARKNELMTPIASQLSADDIRALAAAWGRMPQGTPSTTPAAPAIPSRMVLPATFPQGFTVYETITNPDNARVTRRWANDAALHAAREGRPLPHGSMIVVANYAPAQGDQPLSYAAMESRAGWGVAVPELLRNGDWDYASFGADRVRRDQVHQAACLACHKPLVADSFVFTLKALRQAALE